MIKTTFRVWNELARVTQTKRTQHQLDPWSVLGPGSCSIHLTCLPTQPTPALITYFQRAALPSPAAWSYCPVPAAWVGHLHDAR